ARVGVERPPVVVAGGRQRATSSSHRELDLDPRSRLEHRAMSTLETVAAHIREQAAAYCESSRVPGYLAGVYHDGDEAVVSHGIANLATGAPMRDDTGFLLGSVTKTLTATLVLQQVERGAIDLDERVVTYLP